MSKLSIRKSRGELCLVNEILYPESISERNLFFISKNKFPDFLLVKCEKTKKKTLLVCNYTGLLSLEEMFRNPISKQHFLHIVSLMIDMMKELKVNVLKESCLCFDKKYVFYDQQADKVKMIFWPIVNNQLSKTFGSFAKSLTESINIDDVHSHEFLNEYDAFFDTIDPFSLNKFEKMIDSMSGKRRANDVNETGLLNDNAFNQFGGQNAFQATVLEYDPFVALMSSQTYWAMGEGERFQDSNSAWSDQNTQLFARASLVRQKNGERIPVIKSVFVIGKSKQGCDYRVEDNSAVSRQHVQIAEKDGKYYIADLNSSNKTYLNDFELKPQQYYELMNGAIIHLANEGFEFKME